MVVLSRPRSSGSTAPKTGAKLSIPPPLNLPSLKKEHERFDPSSGPGASTGAIGSGSGSGIGSVGMGWTKPSSFQEKDLVPFGHLQVESGSSYTRPVTHTIGLPTTSSEARIAEKAIVLRGEDFPSLLASFNSTHKQKDTQSSKQKSKHLKDDQEVLGQKMGKSEPNSPLYGHSKMKSFRPGTSGATGGDPFGGQKQQHKLDGFLDGSLVTVRLSHTSDWADDERDTGLHIPDRDKDWMLLRPEFFDARVVRDVDTNSHFTRGFLGGDLVPRDLFTSKEGRDVNTWRTPSQQRDRLRSHDVFTDKDRIGVKSVGSNKVNGRESNFGHFDNNNGLSNGGAQDGRHGRREYFSTANLQNGYEQSVRGRYGNLSSNQLQRDGLQNNAGGPKGSFSSVSHKGFSSIDQVLDFGREKWSVSNGSNSYLESSCFDLGDAFSGDIIADVNVKVLKKKDTSQETNFHDPVRESFEAELDRVQRIQEQERQRALEEQARALEMARKDEEERERAFREEGQIRRKLEEEAREAALRAEQERLEAVRRSEELKIARDEEKKRILMEEERRKEAARQKLLELEARIARRKSESAPLEDSNKIPPANCDKQASALVKERDPGVPNLKNYHDDGRVVDRSASSLLTNYSTSSKSFDLNSRSHSSRDVTSSVERNKTENSWKRDAQGVSLKIFPPDQQAGFRSSNRDGFGPSKGLSKDYVPSRLMPTKPFDKGGMVEPSRFDGLPTHPDGNHFVPNNDADTEFLESNNYGDDGWSSSKERVRTHSFNGERLYPDSEVDSLPFSRSRHSMRQPRVLPPLSTSSSNYERNVTERTDSSSFASNEVRYRHTPHVEGKIQEPNSFKVLDENTHLLHNKDMDSPKCESQSSLSVSSPPSSPIQPSHDDLDNSGNSLARPTSSSHDQAGLTSSQQIVYTDGKNMVLTLHSVASVLDDDWANENNVVARDQVGYNGKRDKGGDENLDLANEFEDFGTDVQSATAKIGQVDLEYNEGLQVEIPEGDQVDAAFMDSGKPMDAQSEFFDTREVLIHDSADSNDFQAENAHGSSNALSEAEKELHELVLDPVLISTMEAVSTFGVPVSQSMTPGLVMPTVLPIKPTVSTISAISSQIEVPVKLQFGLFSTPSLIPTPLPAIQIGSLQLPLQLHHQVETMSQVQPSQRSLFQFGQLRYPPPPPPIPQSIMSFVQPSTTAECTMNQNNEGTFSNQVSKDFPSQHKCGEKSQYLPVDMQAQHANKGSSLQKENLDYSQTSVFPDSFNNDNLNLPKQRSSSVYVENKPKPPSTSLAEHKRFGRAVGAKNYRQVSSGKKSNSYIHEDPCLPQFSEGEKAVGLPKIHGMASGIRGRRMSYAVRNGGSRLPHSGSDALNMNSSGFQRRSRRNVCRTEFRVRGNIDKRPTEDINSSNYPVHYGDSNVSEGIYSSTIPGFQDATLSVTAKMTAEKGSSVSDNSSSQVFNSNENVCKVFQKEAKSNARLPAMHTPHVDEGNFKRSGSFVEDMDSPIHSGVVRIYKQAGIETPSDEDDFIEVRSKRQMLSVKREQREKESKAKSKVIKAPRRQHTVSQSSVLAANSNGYGSSGGGAAASGHVGIDSVVSFGRGSANVDPPPLCTSDPTSLHLSPIAISTSIVDCASRLDSLNSLRNDISSVGDNIVQGSPIEMKNVVHSNASASFGSWGDAEVISLTQSQLDDAMNPAIFDASAVAGVVLDSCMTPICAMRQEKTFSSESSLNSLLSGDKIQFGAMTSPTILPPVSRSTSHKVGTLGSKRNDVPSDLVASTINNNRNSFFDKEAYSEVRRLEDNDAEAEAAASAVAVAAISSNDDVIRDGSALTSVSVAEGKSFIGANQEISGQSTSEEPLAVSLPADLSVDTPLSLWPPLPSPQSSSGSMLSLFHGMSGSHFPCLDVSHVLGAPNSQLQSQRGAIQGSGQPGGWAQGHSGVDSFYGPSLGFSGPFINPGGIPRPPPHMVFYNHFSPVGQYGQVGLGFMGATYMPPAKQSEWKHVSVSAGPGVGESGEVNNMCSVPFQRNPPNVTGPIQHLSSGSPLVPMASPVALFDMSPFQSSAEIVMHARWPQIPAPPLPVHAVPLNMSLPRLQQHQMEAGVSLHFKPQNSPVAVGNNFLINHYNEPSSSLQADGNKDLPSVSDLASRFPDELVMGVAPPSPAGGPEVQTGQAPSMKGGEVAKNLQKSGADNRNKGLTTPTSLTAPLKPHPLPTPSGPPPPHQQHRVVGSECHRRLGFHRRGQSSFGSENHPSSKVKQIYVAKQTSVSGSSSTS